MEDHDGGQRAYGPFDRDEEVLTSLEFEMRRQFRWLKMWDAAVLL